MRDVLAPSNLKLIMSEFINDYTFCSISGDVLDHSSNKTCPSSNVFWFQKNAFHIIYSYEDFNKTIENTERLLMLSPNTNQTLPTICMFIDSETINFGKFYSTIELLIKKIKRSYLLNILQTLQSKLQKRSVVCVPLMLTVLVSSKLTDSFIEIILHYKKIRR